MKYIKISISLLLLIAILISCKKTAPDDHEKTLLYKENISNIKKGEPISVTFGDDDITSKVEWLLSPNNNTKITTIANNATILFDKAGTYTVTASMENVYAIYTITVEDVFYTPDYGTKFNMTAPKFFGIKKNEPITFSTYNSNSNAIGWSVFPSDSVNITRDNINKKATIRFAKSGFVAVYATDGIDTIRRTILVDPPITNPNLLNANFMLGDRLQLTPSIEGNKLIITATTSRKYNCSSDNILSFSFNSEYEIDYSGVSIAPLTCSSRSFASCVNSFKNIKIGTHTFSVGFQNKTYKGTITLDNAGKYKFDWKDNSVVSIFPTTL
jgi:hypothetical protein